MNFEYRPYAMGFIRHSLPAVLDILSYFKLIVCYDFEYNVAKSGLTRTVDAAP